MRWLLLAHASATLFMVGLIWTIQLVHYPLFELVGRDNFTAYQAEHQWRISLIVAPVMLAELALGGALLLFGAPVVPRAAAWAGVALLAVVWLSTFFVQTPQHSVLVRGFDADAVRMLVQTNWLRTAAWTARGGLALWLLYRLMGDVGR